MFAPQTGGDGDDEVTVNTSTGKQRVDESGVR